MTLDENANADRILPNRSTDDAELNDQILRRHEEYRHIKELGFEPYPYSFDRADYSADIVSMYEKHPVETDVSVAGRIVAMRRMGKASFCHIADSKGKIQIYLKKDDLGAVYDAFRLFDIGDIVGVKGFVFRTKTGEISIHAREFQLLAKSLRPLPVVKEKTDEQGNKIVFDPFSDKELRYRQRYVDLAVNPEVKEVFIKRSLIIRAIRRFLDSKGYLEVETPVLQPIYGGAAARPFKTFHNALGMELFLRIADELYLKRLLVGGFDAVYEIAKDFRNEGMDRMHNPEFTMLELYVAYKDYLWMMDLVEELFSEVVKEIVGIDKLTVGDATIGFGRPWKRLTMFEAIQQFTGLSLFGTGEEELRNHAKTLGIEVTLQMGVGALLDAIFSAKVQPHLIQPTFITDYPIELSPLAKRHRSVSGLVERFEGFVNGQEICNAFSELNDPIDQKHRFEEQRKLRDRGDQEAHAMDEDFLRALEYGMPPAAGLGIGIDRLIMILTNQPSIRDVVLFPQMKHER